MAKKNTAKSKDSALKKSNGLNGRKLVIVESPTKAKTIRKFLGRGYMVESCMGHIRDLPQSAKDIPEKIKKLKWGHLGVNVEKDFEPVYTIPKSKTKVVNQLKARLAEADELILATDEDREGESISWHLLEALKPNVPVKRMVFHEITKEAIEDALTQFRDINYDLVRAQEARRILDRLVGYTISPLIWKKVAYGLSAGRVQSVAVKLICERELERMKFKKANYWSLLAQLDKASNIFEARILSYKDKRVAIGKDFDPDTGDLFKDKKVEVLHLDEAKANQLQKELLKQVWTVTEVEEKPVSRKPAAPFITSTLQQEANRKLGMGAKEAMRVAQSLYEQGFITYMRTDSVSLSEQAIKAARKSIEVLYGKDYLPPQPRTYTHKQPKGAQEAHEAIRPAGTDFVLPEKTGLKAADLKLYELIWKRTVACQMVDSRQKQASIRIKSGDALFAASGMTIEFPGFLKAYEESRDEEADEKGQKLPQLKQGDKVTCKDLEVNQHETKPPARFTEASLIQTMEKEGIGRPSTYAPTIGTIIDRGYARKIGPALAPTFTALVVNKMLSKYLPQYVDMNFTSKMEDSLDEIAGGELDSIEYLTSIYFGKNGLEAQVKKQEKAIEPEEARSIQLIGLPGYDVRVGRYGAYICRPDKKTNEDVCASLPDGQAPGDVTVQVVEKLIDQKINGADALGKDPETGKPIYVLTGRFGPYVQLGDVGKENNKVKRVSIPPAILPENVDMPIALSLLSLPRLLGLNPGTQKEIKLGLGRFGPFVVCDGDYRSIPKAENFLDTTFERAIELFSQPKKGRGRSTALKELGAHPNGEKVSVFSGKYGPYIKCGKLNVSLPEDQKPEDVTLAQALQLITDKHGGAAANGDANKSDKNAEKKTKIAKATKAPKAEKNVKALKDEKVAKAPKKVAKKTKKKTEIAANG